MIAELRAALGLTDLTPLYGGRTNHVFLAGDRVVKLYRKNADTPLFRNAPDDEWIALNALAAQKLAPDPIARHSLNMGEVLIYAHISGPTGYDDISAVARLLARVHAAKPPELPNAARDIRAQGLAMLPDAHPLGHVPIPVPQTGHRALIHSDPVYSNFVQGSDGLRLIDWQSPAIGDPVEDLAHFLSPAMQTLYAGRPLNTSQVSTFLAASDPATVARYKLYGQAFHWRMACYCAWQIAQGKLDYEAPYQAEFDALSGDNLH